MAESRGSARENAPTLATPARAGRVEIPEQQPCRSEGIVPNDILNVLYCYAGEKRKSAMREAIEAELHEREALALEEIDLLQGGAQHDLLDKSVEGRLAERIDAMEFDCTLCSPPCESWTRLKFANGRGPGPVRSRAWTHGFPWNKPQQQAEAEAGSAHVSVSINLLTRQ